MTKISKALQAIQGDQSHGAVTLSSQFIIVLQSPIGATIRIGQKIRCLPYVGFIFIFLIKSNSKGRHQSCQGGQEGEK